MQLKNRWLIDSSSYPHRRQADWICISQALSIYRVLSCLFLILHTIMENSVGIWDQTPLVILSLEGFFKASMIVSRSSFPFRTFQMVESLAVHSMHWFMSSLDSWIYYLLFIFIGPSLFLVWPRCFVIQLAKIDCFPQNIATFLIELS